MELLAGAVQLGREDDLDHEEEQQHRQRDLHVAGDPAPFLAGRVLSRSDGVHRTHAFTSSPGPSCNAGRMAEEQPDTWRSRLGQNAGRRGVPLTTIVVATAVAIGLLDLNAALIVGLWVLRKIVLYVVDRLLPHPAPYPAHALPQRRGLSHGVAATVVFLGGLLVLAGLVYLFASPLVTSAVHFGHEIPDLIKNTRKGRGPLGRLVFRLHLQKYLSEGSAKLTKQLTKVLKPATAFSVGAAAVSDAGHHRHHRRADLLHHARVAAPVARVPQPVPPGDLAAPGAGWSTSPSAR